jgi:hypothetical protein
MKENQNPWHTHTFNIQTSIQQNKKVFTKTKPVGELSRTNDIPYVKHYYQIKGQNSSKRGQNGMEFYQSPEMLTNKPQSKFQFDMSKMKLPEANFEQMDRQYCILIHPD